MMRLLCGGAAILFAFAVGVLASQGPTATRSSERFTMRVVATGLAAPWEVTYGPDQQLWVTERTGKRIVRINPADGSKTTLLTLPDVQQVVTQDGLLGLALHPDLIRGTGGDFVYVSFTYDDAPGTEVAARLGVRRYRYDRASRRRSSSRPTCCEACPHTTTTSAAVLPSAPIAKLYLTVGDRGSNFGQNRCNVNRAQELPTSADVKTRNWSVYAGKVLRIDLDGSIPSDNPTIAGVRSHVFSYGHRNPLGIAFGPNGRLYESEHGPDTDDEVNLIEGGRNYGWPHVAGFRDDKAYVYANWSASSPQPCASLPGRGATPASVPAADRDLLESSSVHATAADVLHVRRCGGRATGWRRDDRTGRA